jgi:hypothetical protein
MGFTVTISTYVRVNVCFIGTRKTKKKEGSGSGVNSLQLARTHSTPSNNGAHEL